MASLMSGDVTNYARLYGMVPFEKAAYYRSSQDSTNVLEFRSDSGGDIFSAPSVDVIKCHDAAMEYFPRKTWLDLYANDEEYDIMACWLYLGFNPCNPALGAPENPFEEGFDDAFG